MDYLCLEVEVKALLTLDVWYGHRHESFKGLASGMYTDLEFVPAGSTDETNACDVALNGPWKKINKDGFTRYCTESVQQGTPIDLRLSNLKPKHLEWNVEAWNYFNENPQIVMNGFAKALG